MGMRFGCEEAWSGTWYAWIQIRYYDWNLFLAQQSNAVAVHASRGDAPYYNALSSPALTPGLTLRRKVRGGIPLSLVLVDCCVPWQAFCDRVDGTILRRCNLLHATVNCCTPRGRTRINLRVHWV